MPKSLFIIPTIVVFAFGLISAIAGWLYHPILYMSGLMSIPVLVILDRLRTGQKISPSVFLVQTILLTICLPMAFF